MMSSGAIRDRVSRAVPYVVALLVVVVCVSVAFWLLDVSVGEAWGRLWQGAFGDKFAWSRTLVKFAPLVLIGCGIAVAWRAGMYNIGSEGQYIVAGMAAMSFALLPINWPPIVGILGMALVGMISAGLYAMLAAWLYIKRGVDVVIGTILLNFVALQILGWSVRGPLSDPNREVPLSPAIDPALRLPAVDVQTDLHLGIGIALLVALAIHLILKKTPLGFRMRYTGENYGAARAARLKPDSHRYWAMAISGGLAGLAASIDLSGFIFELGDGFAQGWGFVGIPVALIGGLNPLGIIPAAFAFAALFAGSAGLSLFISAAAPVAYLAQGAAVIAYAVARGVRKPRLSEGGESG